MRTWHRLSGHVEVASHIPQLEGPATKIYNCVQGGFGEIKAEKKKDWRQLLAQVPIFKTNKQTKKIVYKCTGWKLTFETLAALSKCQIL